MSSQRKPPAAVPATGARISQSSANHINRMAAASRMRATASVSSALNSTANTTTAFNNTSNSANGSMIDVSSIHSSNSTILYGENATSPNSILNRSNSSSSLSNRAPSPSGLTTLSTTTLLPKSQNISHKMGSSMLTKSTSSSTGGGQSGDLVKNVEELVAKNKLLEEENNVLRNIIQETTAKPENFDSRRILTLKCQVYQLEKQINILAKSLSFRKNSHAEAMNVIVYLSDSFRSIIQSSNGRVYEVEKSEMQRWVEKLESAKAKLFKNQDNGDDMTDMTEPSLFHSSYSNKKNGDSVNLLEQCSGNLNHVNLKQVSFLESNLADLYKKLSRLNESLKTMKSATIVSEPSTKPDLIVRKDDSSRKLKILPFHTENLNTQLEACISSTKQSCDHLFDLSLIVPSAPWAPLKKSPIEDLSQESLATKLKSFGLPKIKSQPVEMFLKSYMVASNYQSHMRKLELTAVNEELKFYRSSYAVQRFYIESVMDLFKTKYEAFIAELNESFNQPLTLLIEKFWQMKSDSSESNLKEFLGLFKVYAKRFETVLKQFELLPKSDLITETFVRLHGALDDEVAQLNRDCACNLEKIDFEKLDLNELSTRASNLLSEIVISTNDGPAI